MQDILLLHGAIGSRDQLGKLVAALSDKWHVHTLDFNGHGENPSVNEYFSIKSFAQDTLDYQQQHGIKEPVIFGYSMGGYVAMYLARFYPGTVSRIITLATKFHWDEAVAAKEIRMLNVETILEKVPDFARVLKQRHGTDNWKTVLEKTTTMLLKLGASNDLTLSDYKQITVPCLLLLGDKDKMVTVEETIVVEQSLPFSEYRLLQNTPHPIEQVDIKMLARIIDEFAK